MPYHILEGAGQKKETWSREGGQTPSDKLVTRFDD